MRMSTTRTLVAVLVSLAGLGLAQAANWPNWRGPRFNGVAEGTNYPLHWSKSENVLWKYEFPGKGASTPIVWGDRIIVTSAIEGQNGVICLGRGGKLLWQQKIGTE